MSRKQKSVMTNALRIIAAAKIPHTVIEYETDGEIGRNFGEHTAEKTGVPKEQSFKTLAVRCEKKGIMTACIPCDCEVDLKKFAKEAGAKKAELIHVKELLEVTGYERGSVSPIGMKKKYPTYLNATALNFDEIVISGGMCGVAVRLRPKDIQRLTGCGFADIVKDVQ